MLNSQEILQRSALLLLNGVVYVAMASNDSTNGWLIGYNESTFARQGVFCVTRTERKERSGWAVEALR
jgi:hypothetical protein